MRIQPSGIKLLLATGVAVVTVCFSVSLRACPIEGPDEKMTLAHFWTFSVGDADFGIREWRCSGNASAGLPARTYTTVFLGSSEFGTRTPVLTVIGIGLGSLCAIGLLGGVVVRTRSCRTPEYENHAA